MRNLPVTLALIAAVSPVAFAQPVPPPPSTTQPPAPGPNITAAPGETLSPASTQPWGPTTQISMNFRDASIDAVLEYLSTNAGFVVVKESPVSGRVTVLSRQPVSPDEAVALLNTVLKQQGYTAIQMGRVLKITSRDRAKRANIPVRFGSDPEKIAQTDELITQVIPVVSVDAVRLKTDLQPLIGTDADWSANGASNTLIMTDTSANIRRVVEIIASLDKRESTENTIRVKQLKYADATSAARLILEIFQSDQSTSGNRGGNNNNNNNRGGNNNPFFRNFGGGGGFGGGGFGGRGGGGQGGNNAEQGSTEGRTGRVTASADTRTNTVVVTGPTATLDVIEKMLDELDANPAAEQAFFIYPLRNGQATYMAQTLNSLFGNSTSGSSRTTTSTNSRTSTSSGFGSRGSTGSSSTFGSGSSISRTPFGQGTTGSSGFGGFGGFGNISSSVQSAAGSLQGQAYVVADPDTNSLLVSASSKITDQVRQIIAQLDRPVPQVLIKVLVAEVTHNNSTDIGTDLSILNLYEQTANSTQGQQAATVFGAPTNGLKVSVLEENVQATLHALATQGRIEVLSRPYILASDNQAASINIGQRVPIITDSRLDTNNNPINQITYQDIGIILNITPHINPDGLVICDVTPEVSSISDQTVAISSTVNATVFNNRSADTRVGIRNGETIVIGGLMEDRKRSTLQKVPLLGDIPLLGVLFSRNDVSKTKTELLFFLTPHVASSPESLQGMTNDEAQGLKLVPGAIQPGTYEEHLKGLQRGNTTRPGYQPVPIPETEGSRSPGALPDPVAPGTSGGTGSNNSATPPATPDASSPKH